MAEHIALTQKSIESSLKDLDGWSHDKAENKITKEFKFLGFGQAISFINRLMPYFERTDHHPDIHIFYNRIRFDLNRLDIGGKITEQDMKTAKIIEKNYADLK